MFVKPKQSDGDYRNIIPNDNVLVECCCCPGLNFCTLAVLIMTILTTGSSTEVVPAFQFYRKQNMIQQLLMSPLLWNSIVKKNTMRIRSQSRYSPYIHCKFTVQDTYCSYSNTNDVENGCTCEMAHCMFGCTHCPASS